MRKIVNSEQIDHCRDNGSDRELHRLLEAPAARFNIILLIIIVILGYYHYHHHHRHWHYHHHFCENIYEGTNLSDFDAEKELLNSAGEATSISQAWNCDYHKGCTAMPIFWTLNFEHWTPIQIFDKNCPLKRVNQKFAIFFDKMYVNWNFFGNIN